VNGLCGANHITEACHKLAVAETAIDGEELEAHVNQTFEKHGNYESVNLMY